MCVCVYQCVHVCVCICIFKCECLNDIFMRHLISDYKVWTKFAISGSLLATALNLSVNRARTSLRKFST